MRTGFYGGCGEQIHYKVPVDRSKNKAKLVEKGYNKNRRPEVNNEERRRNAMPPGSGTYNKPESTIVIGESSNNQVPEWKKRLDAEKERILRENNEAFERIRTSQNSDVAGTSLEVSTPATQDKTGNPVASAVNGAVNKTVKVFGGIIEAFTLGCLKITK